VLSVVWGGIEPTRETMETRGKKGAGIDPNGAIPDGEPVIPTKKGAGIDPNG
jgi:hypothetical protein